MFIFMYLHAERWATLEFNCLWSQYNARMHGLASIANKGIHTGVQLCKAISKGWDNNKWESQGEKCSIYHNGIEARLHGFQNVGLLTKSLKLDSKCKKSDGVSKTIKMLCPFIGQCRSRARVVYRQTAVYNTVCCSDYTGSRCEGMFRRVVDTVVE